VAIKVRTKLTDTGTKASTFAIANFLWNLYTIVNTKHLACVAEPYLREIGDYNFRDTTQASSNISY
jgi:hypothetical protein